MTVKYLKFVSWLIREQIYGGGGGQDGSGKRGRNPQPHFLQKDGSPKPPHTVASSLSSLRDLELKCCLLSQRMCLRRDQDLMGWRGRGIKKEKENSDLEEKTCRTWKKPRAGPTHLPGSGATSRSTESTALQATGSCPWRVPSRPF